MVAAPAHLNESHLATPEVISPLRHAVADYARAAGIRGEQLDDVRLAVSEAVTNVVVHAYPDQPGRVHLTARLVDNELWVLVADEGVGLSTPTQRPGLGWGLAFITDASDEFTIAERAGGGAEARMVFRLPVDAATAGGVGDGDSAGAAQGAGPVVSEQGPGDTIVSEQGVGDAIVPDLSA